jgi:ABC-type glycerol-3-phosphate transport system substrate-binding protein
MRLKKISKRGTAIIALVVVLGALAGSSTASAAGFGASWVSSDKTLTPTASWGELF